VRTKSENPRFEISYSLVAPSGGADKNLNMGAQIQTIAYIQSLQTFLNARLNSVSVSTIGGTAFHFWHFRYELDSFSWHHVMS